MTLARSLRLPEMTLPQHNLTRYIHVQLSVDDGVMVWNVPRLVLGVISVGRHDVRVPVDRIRSMRLQNWTLRPFRLLFAVALMVGAIALTPWWMMTPLIATGLWIGFVSVGPSLRMMTTDGETHRAAMCFGHRLDVELFIEAANDLGTAAPRPTAP